MKRFVTITLCSLILLTGCGVRKEPVSDSVNNKIESAAKAPMQNKAAVPASEESCANGTITSGSGANID